MPCDSVSVAVVQLTEQGVWLLAQMRERPELKDAIMLAIAEELRRLLPESERWEVTVRDYAAVVQLLSRTFDRAADVELYAARPVFRYTPRTAQAFIARVNEAVGGALNAVAAQLIALLTKADMEASGFEIIDDTVRENGDRVIDWEYEGTQ